MEGHTPHDIGMLVSEIVLFPGVFVEVDEEPRVLDAGRVDESAEGLGKPTSARLSGRLVYNESCPKLSKPMIDQIDMVLLGRQCGFTEDEFDVIIYHDIKCGMGRDAGEDE